VNEEIRASHAWVTRTLYLNGQESKLGHYILHFEDPDDDSAMQKVVLELLVEFGQELSLGDYSPIQMDLGRYFIKSHAGFSVVEVAPCWTQEQIDQMDEEPAVDVDMAVWGSLFVREDLPHEGNV
jgi:hypothetical protein